MCDGVENTRNLRVLRQWYKNNQRIKTKSNLQNCNFKYIIILLINNTSSPFINYIVNNYIVNFVKRNVFNSSTMGYIFIKHLKNTVINLTKICLLYQIISFKHTHVSFIYI